MNRESQPRAYRMHAVAMFGESAIDTGQIEDGAQCPCCGYEYVHAGTPHVIDGDDSYRAGWGGRGDLIIVPFGCECGSEWDLCFGFHKGLTQTFLRVRADCRSLTGEDRDSKGVR